MKFTAYNFPGHYLAIVHPSLVDDWNSALSARGVNADSTEDVHVLPHGGVNQLCRGYQLPLSSDALDVINQFVDRT
jgi:hypothetical protein